MRNDETFWKHKLMAFLHDPPCKCFGIAGHEERAAGFRRAAGIDEEQYADFARVCDHTASAADRFPFPRGHCSSTFTGDEQFPFKHPLCDSEISFKTPVESGELAEGVFQSCLPVFPNDFGSRERFFVIWRLWAERAAETDGRLAYLPADTRMPDHTIWNHMALTSALQGCVDDKGLLQPAFLLFQLGPVQAFIAQAAKTRDLRAGSYLLSFLVAHAIKAVTDCAGPDAVIFPSLRGQPLFDMLHRETIFDRATFSDGKGGSQTLWQRMYDSKVDSHGLVPGINESIERLLTPTIPNRFLALVPADEAEMLAQRAERALRVALETAGDTVEATLRSRGLEIDHARWKAQVDRFPSITWQVTPWQTAVPPALTLWNALPAASDAGFSPAGNLEQLYRIACETIPADHRDRRFYASDAKSELKNTGFAWAAHYAMAEYGMAARRNTRNFVAWDSAGVGQEKDVLSGIEEGVVELDKDRLGAVNAIKREFFSTVLAPMSGYTDGQFDWSSRFVSTPKMAGRNRDQGNPYVAVLSMDGDEMGKWMSGAKMRPFVEKLAGKAPSYFRALLGDKAGELRRPLSPAWHAQLSEALSNFSLHLARRVVAVYQGQLIYAGGDDVLAMLPADKALDCARALRGLFRGVWTEIPEPVRTDEELGVHIGAHGFVTCGRGYPLLVPGPEADVSCGIAVAHMHHPLQAIVREAHEAERRAKGTPYGRSAVALTLLKRSGEITHWGAKWDGAALKLWDAFVALMPDTKNEEAGRLPGRFAYSLAELISPYELGKPTRLDMRPVVLADLEKVIERQGRGVDCLELARLAKEYLADLGAENGLGLAHFADLFLAATFVFRARD